jgi:two-component system, chemotaxis family, protein-glutamate methylesterase/glutaminase
MVPGRKLRVVVADDSMVAREMLAQILNSDPDIEVVGQAEDGLEAVEMVERLRPDLITMDIHMPKLDGLKATERIMAFTPTPILVVSSSVYGQGMGSAFDALNLGALEVIKKPEPRDWAELEKIGRDVIRKVKILANVRVITHISGRRDRDEVPVKVPERPVKRSIVAIGSSTGGPSVLLGILSRLPADIGVPIVVAQHIADGFVPGLVSWLDAACKISVVAAEDGQRLSPGVAYFAPTGMNMVLDGSVMRYTKSGQGQVYVPSADALFASVATAYGNRSIGVILTGMGADGAEGLKLMRNSGAATIAQDEQTCTVFGMPKAAIDIGAAEQVLPSHGIAEAVELLLS